MKPVDYQTSGHILMRSDEFFHRAGIAFPHIRREGSNRGTQSGWNLRQKVAYARFFRSGSTASTRTLPLRCLVVTIAA
jgi:hypothetical protein